MRIYAGLLYLAIVMATCSLFAQNEYTTDSDRFRSAIKTAGKNADQLLAAVKSVQGREREGLLFLICNMPERDLKSLSADFLIDNLKYAYRAWDRAPWRDEISERMFLNNILPYVNLNERRDAWRADFYEQFMPIVSDCQIPAEAAVKLNQTIFEMHDVVFSRERPKADQSPYETIEAGMASCSGLSILLVDACRAVGVPARVAGIPLWPDKSGNHSWVEIWDGEWHYTGAAEPQGEQLDQAWFTEKAKTTISSHPLHRIYAASFEKTGLIFPLPWGRSIKYVHAVNVTDRYNGEKDGGSALVETGEGDLQFDLEASMHALRQLRAYLDQGGDIGAINEQSFASVPLSEDHAAVAQDLVWNRYAEAIKKERADEMERRLIELEGKRMPFFYSVNGQPQSAGGRSLFISLHGGGGAPKAVNDQQWENHKRLYRIDEGVYVAPRAPNDAWNMWFQDHIDAMFDRIIENMVVFENVDPNRVYLMGYSAGGDGMYRMGPRMADRWAAAAMMAGHPGDASPINLYNTPFTIHVGENDGAYNRNEEARKWGERLDQLAKANPGAYPHWTKIYSGRGHWVDNGAAAAIPWMTKHAREPFPDELAWRQDKHRRFYWLYSEDLQPGAIIRAAVDGQTIAIDTDADLQLSIRLNDRMLDLDREIAVKLNGEEILKGVPKRSIATIARTITERGDPSSIFSSEITFDTADPDAE